MPSTTQAPFPDFAAPPVVETVFGVEFAALEKWQIPHFGLFWQNIRHEYPGIEIQPPLVSEPERPSTEDRILRAVMVELLKQPPVRCWYIGDPPTRNIVEDHLDTQYQTEIPRKPIIRQFNIHCGHCEKCRKRVRGRHPLQTSDATGAARSQLGADAQAAVVYFNKRAGMSYGKIADTFDKVFGIDVTPGACAQTVLRAGRILQPVYEQIKEHLRDSKHITPDETGWRIGGHPVWLHGWVGDDGTTCYVIDPRRGADVLAEIIGWEWSGTMTHDGLASYDRFEYARHQQCVDHALRRARAMADKQSGAATIFPNQVIDLFTGALAVRDQFLDGKLEQADLAEAYEHYVSALDDLTERPRVHERNNTFATHLYCHGEQWFEFLADPTVPATNHRAEQALKTPIVNRKVWGGNRADPGGKSQEVTSSVLETCKKKAVDAFTFISNAFRGVIGCLFPSDSSTTQR